MHSPHQSLASAMAEQPTAPIDAPPLPHPPTGPRLQRVSLRPRSSQQIYLREQQQGPYHLQMDEIQRLSSQLQDYRGQLAQADSPLLRERLRLEEGGYPAAPPPSHQTIIIKNGDQYRKQLVAARRKRETATLQNQLLEIQMENVQRERENLTRERENLLSENNHHKAQNCILEKELFMVRDSLEKQKRRAGGEIAQLQSELAASGLQVRELQRREADLSERSNLLGVLEEKLADCAQQLGLSRRESEKLARHLAIISDKAHYYEQAHAVLSQNFKNLERVERSAQEELARTNTRCQMLQEENRMLGEQAEKIEGLNRKIIEHEMTKIGLVQQLQNCEAALKEAGEKLQQWETKTELQHQQSTLSLSELTTHFNAEIDRLTTQAAEKADTLTSQLGKSEELNRQLAVELKTKSEQLDHIHSQFEEQAKINQENLTHLAHTNLTIAKLQANVDKLATSEQQSTHRMAETQMKFTTLLNTHEVTAKSSSSYIQERDSTIQDLQQMYRNERTRADQLLNALQQREEETNRLDSLLNEVTEQLAAENVKSSWLVEQSKTKEQIIVNFEQLTADMRHKITHSNQEAEGLAQRNAELAKELSSWRDQHEAALRLVAEKDSMIRVQKALVKQFEYYFEDRNTKLKHTEEERDKVEQDRQRTAEELSKRADQIAKMAESEKELKRLHLQTSEQWEAQQAKLAAQSEQLQAQLRAQQAQNSQLQQANAQLAADLSHSNSQKGEQQLEISNYQAAMAQMHQDIEQLQAGNRLLAGVQENQAEAIEKLIKEREQLSNLLQSKIKDNETLKHEMIAMDRELHRNFEEALENEKRQMAEERNGWGKERTKLMQLVDEGSTHKKKAAELEAHSINLAQKVRETAFYLDNHKVSVLNLAQENDTLRRNSAQVQEALTSRHQEELSTKSKLQEEQSELFNRERQVFREELAQLSKKVGEKETQIAGMLQELNRLHHILVTNDKGFRSEIDFLRALNAQLQNEHSRLSHAANIDAKKLEETHQTIRLLESKVAAHEELTRGLQTEFTILQAIVGELKEERELLIRKHISLVNEIRGKDRVGMSREVDAMEQYFTRVSSLHGQLSKHFSLTQGLFSSLERGNPISVERSSVLMASLAMLE